MPQRLFFFFLVMNYFYFLRSSSPKKIQKLIMYICIWLAKYFWNSQVKLFNAAEENWILSIHKLQNSNFIQILVFYSAFKLENKSFLKHHHRSSVLWMMKSTFLFGFGWTIPLRSYQFWTHKHTRRINTVDFQYHK